MLHILLLILKITGFIILGLLALLLLFTLTVLLNPIQYRIEALFRGDVTSWEGNVSVRWLFRLIRADARYSKGNLYWTLRIFRKKLGNDESEPTDTKPDYTPPAADTTPADQTTQRSGEFHEKEPVLPEESVSEDKTGDMSKDSHKSEQKEKTQAEVEHKKDDRSRVFVETEQGNKTQDKQGQESTGFEDRLISMISSLFHKLKYTFEQLCVKMKALIQKKDLLMRFLSNETHKRAFSKGLKETKDLFRRLKPTRCSADLDFGCKDPAHTGYVLAAVSMIYPLIGEHSELRPDFERQILEGTVSLEGKIRLAFFLIAGCNLIFDKSVRITFRRIRQLINHL